MATGSLKAQIEITADASGVEAGVGKAKRSLADLGATGAAAGKQAAAGVSGIGEGGSEAAGKVDAATRRMIASIQRTTVALESGGRSSSRFFETMAQQKGLNTDALRPYLVALADVESRHKVAANGIQAMNGSMQQFTMSTRASAAALRSVPSQITDIVTGLAAGQPPMQVLLQQGGQLKDIFGGIRPAAQALGSTLLRMISPVSVLGAVVAVLSLGFISGRKEASEYAKAIILTGNAAGTTVGQMMAMAQAVSGIVGTQGKAAETLAAFAASGRVGAADLERFTLAAIRFEREAGQAVGDTVKQFGDLGREPVAASIKLNEATRFLTLSVYQQIKALEEAGRVTEAATLAQRTYANELESRSTQLEARLGLIERAWRGIKDAAKGAWDAMLNVGRPDTLQSQLAKAQAELEKAGTSSVGSASVGDRFSFNKDKQALRDRIDLLQESIRMDGRAADAQRRSGEVLQARVKLDGIIEKSLTKEEKLKRELLEATNLLTAAGASEAEKIKVLANIREKFRDKSAGRSALAIEKAELSRDLAALRQAAAEQVSIYRGQEQILESIRDAGLVSESDYYDAKRGFVRTYADLKQQELRAEIAERRQRKLTGKEAIDNEREIAKLQSQIVISRVDASAQLEVISKREQAAADQLLATFEELRQASNDALADILRTQQRELSGFGLGNAERDRRRGRGELDDRSADERRRIQNERALAAIRVGGEENLTNEQRRHFELRLQIVDNFQSRATASLDRFYDTQRERQADMTLGMNEAFNNYVDTAARTGEAIERIFEKSLGGIEDAFVSLATTGKADFKSLVDSIVADIIRMTVRAQIAGILQSGGSGSGGQFNWAQLLSSVMSWFGGSGFSTASSGSGYAGVGGFDFNRANGGPVSKGRMYEVNEKGGGEIFNTRSGRQYLMPAADGSVSPTGGRGTTLNQTINFVSNEPTSKRTQSQLAAVAQQGIAAGSRNL